MKKYADGKYIKKVQKRLLKVLKKEYGNVDGLYCEIDRVDIYFLDGPSMCMEVRYGRFINDAASDWQRVLDLPLTDGNIDFLAGQFFQANWQTENK